MAKHIETDVRGRGKKDLSYLNVLGAPESFDGRDVKTYGQSVSFGSL